MRAALWGPDHVELGSVAVAEAGPRAAVALTRGRHLKSYSYLDPNEDVVAAVAGDRATLLVCADGHNGATAPVRAVEAVLAELGGDPPPELEGGRHPWPALFGRVNDAVRAAVADSEQPQSRTVLLVALVSPGRVSWGALGDAALVVCRPGERRSRQLNREAMRFVGYPMGQRVLRQLVSHGSDELGAGEWVVLVTDGLSEFIAPMRPAGMLPWVLARAAGDGGLTPAAAARAIVHAAGEAGAGDNVGVAVCAP